MALQKYYTTITDAGTAAITNALARGEKLAITHVAAGDANGTEYSPQSAATALKHEVWRGAVTKCERDTELPNVINVNAVIPADSGGWYVREVGFYDQNGTMIAISNACFNKPSISDGAFADMEIILQMVTASTEAFELKADANVIIATKKDIEEHNRDPQAHAGLTQFEDHINNSAIHVSADDRTRWDGADTLSLSNKVEIDQIWLAIGKHDSRIARLEDAMFNDILGNPWLVTFGDLDGVELTKGCWNQSKQRLEC